MANLFYNGAVMAMNSGTNPATFVNVDRVEQISIQDQIPRVNIDVVGRFAPLPSRPVINYTPVTMSANFIYGDKNIPTCFGLVNSTGIAIAPGNGTQVSDYGCRTFQIYNTSPYAQTYLNEWDVVSGVLKSFSLQGSVGEAVKGAFSVEALDLRQVANNSAFTPPMYSGNIVRPQDTTIAGIDYTGLGFSGLIIQSFNFNANFNHASTFRIGTKYPERRMTQAAATLQLSAFMEGTTNTISGLSVYDCGTYVTGVYVFTLQPSCSTQPATTISFVNPYVESQGLGVQVGNFFQVDLSFSVPLSIVPYEATGNGSNVTIT